MDHEFWMRRALEAAAEAGEDIPVGAVVVKEGRLIASACNRREADGAPFAHAEMLAMNRAAQALNNRRLRGCTLYVTLEPCPMCAGALVLSGIDRVVFGAFDSAYGCCGSLYALPMDERFAHRPEVIGGVLAQEAQALLDDFFAARRA